MNGYFVRPVVISLVLASCSWGSTHSQEIKVDLPRGFQNAIQDVGISASSVIVSVSGEQCYLDGERVDRNELLQKLEGLKLKNQQVNTVYVAGASDAEYGRIVEVLNSIRKIEVGQVGLLVDRGNSDKVLLGTFLINLPMPFREGDDLSKLKPNPLTLMASISSERELALNHETAPQRGGLCSSSVPKGLGTDPNNLQRLLECLFDNRTRQHAYKIGMETRTEVPLAQRIEKTVFVKAAKSLKYLDVLRVIDAVNGAGANPIGLQIDDLTN